MTEFFTSMEPTQRYYWYLAIGVSIIFIIQTVMTFIGGGGDGGLDTDFESGGMEGAEYPFQLFSLRNLINFLLGFGWAGATLYEVIDNGIILAIVATIIGLLFVAIFFFIIRTLLKLSEDNTFSIESALWATGDVYLTIPPSRTGKGKVFISVKGSTKELDAITDHDKAIANGTIVVVTGIEGDMIVVEPSNKL